MYVLCRYVHMYTNLQILDIKVRFEAAFCRIRQFSAVLAVSCHLQQFSASFSKFTASFSSFLPVLVVFASFSSLQLVSAVYSQFQKFTACFQQFKASFSSLQLVSAVYSQLCQQHFLQFVQYFFNFSIALIRGPEVKYN